MKKLSLDATMENVIVVKDEEEEEVTCVNADGSLSSSSSSSVSPQPMEGLHATGPPPFLTKTFEMVEDPSTDPIVSWSTARNSFVVWDYSSFSTQLLPRYFKHSNFSSFIRQLNTYGFRKVDPDRWEFANEGFLGGQRHLLKTIKRRRNVAQPLNHQQSCVEVGDFGLESELDRLRRDRGVLVTEIVRLRHQHQESRDRAEAMEARLDAMEKKQQSMMSFLARALNNPTFFGQLAQRTAARKDRLGAGETGMRKRRLMAGEPEIESLFPDVGGEGDEVSGLGDANEAMWKELLSDELIGNSDGGGGNFGDELGEVEVEELLAQSDGNGDGVDDDWDEDLRELVDQMGYLRSKP